MLARCKCRSSDTGGVRRLPRSANTLCAGLTRMKTTSVKSCAPVPTASRERVRRGQRSGDGT
eukprot:6053465-Pleurochrysis_carterae.AAC.1